VYGNSIDLELEVIAKKGSCAKSLVIDARQCTAPGVHPGNGTPRLFFFQAQISLHLYARQRPPRKRLRSDGLTGSKQGLRSDRHQSAPGTGEIHGGAGQQHG
jgi:hypothetical protein